MGLSRNVRAVSTSGRVPGSPAPRVTVVFLLYNAAAEVAELVTSLARQRHPAVAVQSEWLDALFVDDASTDETLQAAKRALAAAGEPAHYRLVAHTRNLGLAGTLNEVFAEARAAFVLTCHLDCRFGSDAYVASMLELIERTPHAAAITGQPRLPPSPALPFAEKLNVVANLMDVVPRPQAEELVPVGFAEGRCDVFRVAALRGVGLYDTHLRVSGEDQVLAARLRASGFEIFQAPRLEYRLSVSAEQDSIGKLVSHQRLFGRTTPYIVLAVPGSIAGLVGKHAGPNRERRSLLRASQLASCAAYGIAALSWLAGWPAWGWVSALALVAALKLALFARHLGVVRFSPAELLGFLLLQPVLDVAYGAGIAEGLAQLAIGRARPID
jgi:GT2 family glycosyltransferase